MYYQQDKNISQIASETGLNRKTISKYVDMEDLLPLPSVPFDTALYTTATTDKYGKFTLDVGKHRYSASPAFCESIVNLKITSSAVIVMDADMHEVVCHKRLYGDEHERMDWLPYLTYIATALIGRLTHHVELILFPGINNRLRESSINETLSRISNQEAGNNG